LSDSSDPEIGYRDQREEKKRADEYERLKVGEMVDDPVKWGAGFHGGSSIVHLTDKFFFSIKARGV
jgi:hypothetical protein